MLTERAFLLYNYLKKKQVRGERMEAINRAIRRSLAVSVLITAGFLLGIPAIILGAVNDIGAVLGIGIALTAIGFYGTPIAWSTYAQRRGLSRLVSAIAEENIYTVPELADHLTLTEKDVREKLVVCFRNKYLVGYRREGDNIVLNEGRALGKKEYSAECPYCGAKFTYTAGNARCPYCDSPVSHNDRQ